ncbi:DNA-binding MarR family transcriptional regulator [Rhodococcus sp. LBL1]|nr:DNA-binding MarR family transcriptional regulator [Rhodococcus sp. LBL1]MDH6685429.1 DNA-binding MarR family transcriptional regulator [Rhodococcus sp. LBL2]
METRWLDEREDRAWRGLRHMHADLTAHLARQLTREYGLTEADYAVLAEVSEAPDRRIRSRDLGRVLGWERSRLSHQIARMEARGTIRRAPCSSDARGFDVVLTDEGLATIEEAAPLHVTGVRHCFVDLLTPEQLEVLGDIADIVRGHLAAEHLGSTG